MTAGRAVHDQNHAEQVLLYALQTLPPADVPAVEACLARCAECRQELEAVRPVLESFVAWPTDVLRPSAPLWPRLARRIAAEAGQGGLLEEPPPSPRQPEWEEAAPGISVKLLATDPGKHYVSMLVRLAPNTDYPSHRHAGVEELYLLDGVLRVDDRTYHPGDYLSSEPGTVDHRVWSETGCTCVLLTSYRDVIL